MKHTQEKWKVVKREFRTEVQSESGGYICHMTSGCFTRNAKNAKLIAAAPEMIETLKKVEIEITTAEMHFDRKNAILEDIREAIKKATE